MRLLRSRESDVDAIIKEVQQLVDCYGADQSVLAEPPMWMPNDGDEAGMYCQDWICLHIR